MWSDSYTAINANRLSHILVTTVPLRHTMTSTNRCNFATGPEYSPAGATLTSECTTEVLDVFDL